jgi:PAS domain-containing protein
LSELASAQNARDRNGTALNFFSPVRLIVACAVTLALIVVGGAGFIAYNLAHWQRTTVYVVGTAVLILVVIAAFALLFTRLFRNHQALEQAREDCNRAEQLRSQSLRFNVALNNMSHGLVMFDATSRLVVVNARFLEMYGLSPDVVKGHLLKHRKERGSFGGDPEEYHGKILAQIAKRTLTKQNVPTPAGRIIQIVNQPMPDGGWVATHEDITD